MWPHAQIMPPCGYIGQIHKESIFESKPCSKGANWGGEMIGMIGNPTLQWPIRGGVQPGPEGGFG